MIHKIIAWILGILFFVVLVLLGAKVAMQLAASCSSSSVYGMSKFFDVDTVGDCENYIQYCAEYVILEIIRFLDEWKK